MSVTNSAHNNNRTPTHRDPSTYLHRPTSAKTPDVSHILTSLFGEIYTKDIISTDVIKNLTISSDVDNEYHKRYVERLKQAQMIKENRIQEYAMLEKHILEARAKALAYEEREIEKRRKLIDNPDAYGIAPVKSYFSHCLDDSLLKEHGLLVPSDYYYQIKQPFVPMPKNDEQNRHLKETASSKRRTQLIAAKISSKALLPPIANSSSFNAPDLNDIEELHKSGSDEDTNEDEKGGSELSENDSCDEYNMNENFEAAMQRQVKLRSAHTSSSVKSNRKSKKTASNVPFWKMTLRQEHREIDKYMLRKLEEKVQYLPNPRLDAERTGKALETVETVFEVTPKCILFNKYVTGKVYESSFEVRNISLIAHQMRAIPPKTQYFSLSLGQYPQGQSVIAPGLAAIFNIRFAPDSLGTFEDELAIESSNGSKIIVPIIAKRESPSLSIGPVINCGQALVGQIKVCRFVIKNKGGDGRFVIFPKSSWPVSTFKTNLSSSTLSLYPFEIQPSIFELHKGDVFVLEVVFKPPDVKKYEQDIVITCDNCTTIEFKLIGEGELAEIEYIQQDEDTNGGLNENILPVEEYKDKLSSKIIRFLPLNPSIFTRKRFAIKNKSSSCIDYSWIIYKPIYDDSLLNSSEFTNKSINYVLDKDSLFSVAPKQGTLDRNETKTFEIVFSPLKVGAYCSVAHFVMHSIPEINKQLMIEPNVHKTVLTKEDVNTSDFVATVLELRGECEPFQFTLDPPAIFVPGQIYMHSTTRKSFRLINMSLCPINFNWKQILDSSVIQVEPSYGEIAPKSYALMDVLITGVKPGKICDDIPCYVDYADEPVYLHVEAEIKGPEAQIQEAGVDFGLVQLGNSSKSFITVQNISNLALNWKLNCLEYNDFFKYQKEGTLQPLESKRFNIFFMPKDEVIVNTQFKLEVENGNELYFNCFAQAQRPSASFLNSELTLNEIYLNIIGTANAKLCNHSVLEAEFRWGKPEGKNTDVIELSIEPQQGVMKSKSVLDFEIKILATQIGDFDDLRIPCYIHDMTEPLFLKINVKVSGVSVDYFISNEMEFDHRAESLEANPLIDFGTSEVGQNPVKYFFIRNLSGIETKVNFDVKLFKAYEHSTDTKKFVDPMKKVVKLEEKFKITNPKTGLGFVILQKSINLPAFGVSGVALFVLSELWGLYEDTLLINVDGISSQSRISLRADISGTPIKLFAGKVQESENDEISMIRFGSQIQGSGQIVRKLKVQNISSIPIEINWNIYLNDETDDKLVDLNLVLNDESDDLMTIDTLTSSKLANANETSRSRNELRNLPQSNDNNQISLSTFETNNQRNEISSTTSSYEYYENYNYYQIQRVPLLKVKLTKHYGKEILNESSEVYILSTRQIFLKPRETVNIDVIFNSDVLDVSGLFEALFIGYLNLSENFIKGEGFKRTIGFEKDPIKFKATGRLDPPNLTVELDEDLIFDVALGDLIKNENELLRERIVTNKFSLLNSSFAPIEFDLNVKQPFYIGNFTNQTQRYCLKPRTKLKVDIGFKFTKELSDQFDFENKSQIILDENVLINFSKGLKQTIPICSKIYAPVLTATKSSIAFNVCLVGQERCQQFALRNPSYSSLIWSVSIVNNEHDVFRCDVTSGLIKASKAFINKTEQIVNVYFNAKHDESYNSKLIIAVEPEYFGCKNLEIDLSGSGSYDQKYEAFFDI